MADTPTVSVTSSPLPAGQAPQYQQDIADLPTMIVSPESAPTIYAPVPQPVSSSRVSDVEEKGITPAEHSETAQTMPTEVSNSARHGEEGIYLNQAPNSGQIQIGEECE
jgi:hypothetical protein